MTYINFDIDPYKVVEAMYHQALKEAKQSPGADSVLNTISANYALNMDIAHSTYQPDREVEIQAPERELENR